MPDIREIPVKKLMEGLIGYYAHGKSLTFGEVLIEDGIQMPLHHHPHEQITFVLEGELEMQIGEETVLLKPGMYFVIPSNVPHSAYAHGKCRAIDVFSPVREEYITSTKGEE